MKAIVIFLAATLSAYAAPEAKFQPKSGFVPDTETPIKIAVEVWSPIYGAEHIAGEKPYHATLKDGVWTVEGSLPESKHGEIILGGVALARISQKDGCILEVMHGQ
jgi:hypothetical protein